MKKQSSIIGSFLFKCLILISLLLIILISVYLIVKTKSTKSLSWNKLKPESNFNLFKFFGWKWNLLIALFLFLVGISYRWPWWKLIEAYWQRQKLIEFAEGVHMAVISASVGKGKTLLLSILARHLPRGIKKVGFVSNVPDAQLLSYNDINFDEPVSEMDNYRIPKYYFLDETNFWIDGVDFYKNRNYHRGVAWLLQISRHHQMHLWISATRDNHVWVAVREIVNYHVKLGGIKPLMNIGSFSFSTLKVQFYSQSWELEEEFNICVSNLDFALYDSYWLKDTSYFRRQINEGAFFQPNFKNLSSIDQKLTNLSPEEDKNFSGNLKQMFPKKYYTKEQWEDFVNYYFQISKKPTSPTQTETKETNSELSSQTSPEKPNITLSNYSLNTKKSNNKIRKKRGTSSLQDFLKNNKKI